MADKDARIAALEAELKALKPRCLYEGYANARDYLEAVLDLPKFWEMEETFCANKTRYDALVTVRCEPNKFTGVPFRHVLLSTPIPPRADGRKIATASLECTFGCPIKEWFKLYETPYLRNCPLYEGDVFLERLREKHTDEELEDLFYSFQSWEKKTWSEIQPTPLQVAERRAGIAEYKLAEAEGRLEELKEFPVIKRQSAMQMVIAITMIARACPEAKFQEIHDMWAEHADQDFGYDPLTCLCACLKPDCPTFEKVYKKGRGFVSRWDTDDEEAEGKPAGDA
jgi:hypothetical protein